MRCVFGLVNPDAGEVTWNNQRIDEPTMLTFGYMPEERGLYPKMKIGDQVTHFARLSGLDRSAATESAERWLRALDLGDRLDSKLEELSHGNQQRVQLAAALVHDPVVAILDEPFAGLDPIGVDTMAGVLRTLADRGVAIVFSSHQLDLVADVCQDVVIIDHGRSVLAGDVNELQHTSPTRYLHVEVNGQTWARELEGVGSVSANGRHRYVLDRRSDLAPILDLAARDGEITRFAFEPPHLTDLFREAVRR
jgi:ABC-2 type transport system ATP-binding protein